MVEPQQRRRSSRLEAAAAAAARGPASPSPARRKQTANPAATTRRRAPPPRLSSSFPRTRLLLTLLAAQLLLALTRGLYRSTDFEVHRNWLAITSLLPLSRWYRDATSPNATLDYPPLFAWFEWALGKGARFGAAAMGAVGKQGSGSRTWVDAMLTVQQEPHASPECVLFQRLTVVATGLALAAVAWWAPSEPSAPASGEKPKPNDPLLFFLITCNAGLLMVDYVHFQYNGWLMALLLLSILLVERGEQWQLLAQCEQQQRQRRQQSSAAAAAAARTHYLLASVAFAALLNSKHLFAYAAPAFFVYLLRAYVLEGVGVVGGRGGKSNGARRPPPPTTTTILARLALLACAVLAVFALSFGPFVANGTLPDILSRLFPFGRGLLHAYWAPNAWALYAAADKALAAVVGGRLGRANVDGARLPVVANMSGGLVGVAEFAVLPQVGPRAAAVATLAAMLPALVALWRRPTSEHRRFCAAVAHGLLCGFMFGYHVHEKAVITFLLPMALLTAAEEEDEEHQEEGASAATSATAAAAADDFLLASTAGHVGIFPLLFRPQELMLRWALAAFYFVVAAWGLAGGGGGGRAGAATGTQQRASLTLTTRLFACGCVALELFNVIVAPRMLPNLPFLPLMLTSVWCACAISLVWARWTARWLREATAS